MMFYINKLFESFTGIFSILPVYSNSATATETTILADTAYYFNERGDLIWKQLNANNGCYVIKTRRKFDELYHDYLYSNRLSTYMPADAKVISSRLSKKVEKLIRKGKIDEPLVVENVFEILNRTTLRNMRRHITYNDNPDDSSNYREYGGIVTDDGTITSFVGEVKDLFKIGYNEIHIIGSGSFEFHSHPAGRVVVGGDDPYELVMTVSAKNTRNYGKTYFAYMQGPSRIDQQSVGVDNRIGYVFGMGSKLIYIYDYEGVKATLPLTFAE